MLDTGRGMDIQNAFMLVGSALMKAVLRSPLHWALSNNTLLIAFVGRKSGCKYCLPVNYVPDGNILYITSQRDHAWWRNLRGGAPVIVRLHGRDIPGEGIVIEECGSVMENLKRFFQVVPKFAKYFSVRLDVNGKPDEQDISRVARQRVIVKVCLNGARN